MLSRLVWETIGPFGTNGCHDGVHICDGTLRLFNQSQASMEGPITDLDSITIDPSYPSKTGVCVHGTLRMNACLFSASIFRAGPAAAQPIG